MILDAEGPEAPVSENSLLCFDFAQIQKLQEEMVAQISLPLSLPSDVCRALLRAYFWDKERVIGAVMDSPEEAFKISGTKLLLRQSRPCFKSQRFFSCAICCNDATNQETLRLQCGHTFCLACHKRFYEQSIIEGKARKIVCPGSCGTLVQDETLQRVVSPETFLK